MDIPNCRLQYIIRLVKQTLQWICFTVLYAVSVSFSYICQIWGMRTKILALTAFSCYTLPYEQLPNLIAFSLFLNTLLVPLFSLVGIVPGPWPGSILLWSHERTPLLIAKGDCDETTCQGVQKNFYHASRRGWAGHGMMSMCDRPRRASFLCIP